MKMNHNLAIVIVTTMAIATAGLMVTEASAGKFKKLQRTTPPSSLGLTANPGRGPMAAVKEHCNNAASCNLMIAYCIGNGGDFEVDPVNGTGAGGKPVKGTCTY